MSDNLQVAMEFHRGGRLDVAGRLYREILACNPQCADAMHLSGVVALQQGDAHLAIAVIEGAIDLAPHVAVFHANLAEACRTAGQIGQAVVSCRTALRLHPEFPEAMNTLGLILHAQGRPDAAAEQFREALRHNPGLAAAHNNLGNALRLLGDKAQAMAHFLQAVQIDRTLALAWSNLGQLLLEDGQLDEALESCREAVCLQPGLAETQCNLGNALFELGRLEEAAACYAEALRVRPDLAVIYNNIGQVLREEGELSRAVDWYQQALERAPDSARIHCNLADALEALERRDEAVVHYKAALDLDPGYADANCGLGSILLFERNYRDAQPLFRWAIRQKPDLAAAHCHLGTLLEELNDLEGAEASFRDALRHDNRCVAAHHGLAMLLRGKLPEPDLDAMQDLLAGAVLTPVKRSVLQFGLAQVLDARQNYHQAAEHLEQANAITLEGWRKANQAYDPAVHANFASNMMAACTPEFFARVHGFGLETERPVFIFGLPRSGTTLIEQILGSHSQLFGGDELSFARDDFNALSDPERDEMDPLEALARLSPEAAERIAGWHMARLHALDPSALRVADKMPDNYLYLGLLAALFPRAKFIHCQRDLRDVAVSCWMTNFRHLRWTSHPDHIAGRFHQYLRLMDHWRQVLPVNFLEVDYEELVGDLEGVARRLVEWCGLAWDPKCLAFHETCRPVRTASANQVRQPLYATSVGRWKNYRDSLWPLFARLPGNASDASDGSDGDRPSEDVLPIRGGKWHPREVRRAA